MEANILAWLGYETKLFVSSFFFPPFLLFPNADTSIYDDYLVSEEIKIKLKKKEGKDKIMESKTRRPPISFMYFF